MRLAIKSNMALNLKWRVIRFRSGKTQRTLLWMVIGTRNSPISYSEMVHLFFIEVMRSIIFLLNCEPLEILAVSECLTSRSYAKRKKNIENYTRPFLVKIRQQCSKFQRNYASLKLSNT